MKLLKNSLCLLFIFFAVSSLFAADAEEAELQVTQFPIAPQAPAKKGAPFTLVPLEEEPSGAFKEVQITPAATQAPEAVKKSAPKRSLTEELPAPKKLRKRRSKRFEPPTESMADVPLTEEEKKKFQEIIDTDTTAAERKKEEHKAFTTTIESGGIQLGQYLEPWKGTDPKEKVEMNFDNKELTELLKFLAQNLDIDFILDDAIEPNRADGLQPLAGTKITFKSTVPLTLKEAWDIGLTFLEMAGFSVVPSTLPRTYRVTVAASTTKPSANREPMPTFIGTDPEEIPNTDAKIRYVYFAENADLSTITQIIESMKSGSAGPLLEVPQLRAVIITDRAAIIRSMMNILREIDSVTLPETLSIIRLKHTDAKQVRELYYRLIGKDPTNPVFGPFARQRKPTTVQYFSEATRVFEEPFTNSLIVLGTRDNIKKFEDFIIKYIDKTLEVPFSPLHIIQLKYIDAASIAKILNDIIQKFNSDPANTAAALVGGVRDGNKFFRPTVRITEETSGNRLIINADYEEYLKIRDLIDKLDVEQPQVAIKVLILNVDLTNTNTLGVQLRNTQYCCNTTCNGFDSGLGPNVNFQTGNLGLGLVTQQPATGASPTSVNGAQRLLGNLINLANAVQGVSPFGAGTTLVTLGQDIWGFWGLLQALEMFTRVSVIANPFLITTHKYKAEIKIGETQRTTTALVEGQREAQAQGDLSADLRVIVTPQISYDDMITLNVYVELTQFINSTSQTRLSKQVSTEALLANKEVLALGGLIQDTINETVNKVPILGDIPLLGWLFKYKTKQIDRSSLLILICPEIIKPYEPETAEAFTFSKISDAKDTLFRMHDRSERRDPIHRWFFYDHKDKEPSTIDKFVSTQQRYIDESQKKTASEALAMKKGSRKKKGLLDLVKTEPEGAQA